MLDINTQIFDTVEPGLTEGYELAITSAHILRSSVNGRLKRNECTIV